MGYSSRYHAASLAAVFVALAVGILIGAALGSDVISGTADNLEQDLGDDLDRLRAENADLEADLEAERDFESQVYPAIVAGRLEGREIALMGLGDVDTEAFTDETEAALGPAGGVLGEVGTVREPPDTEQLIAALQPEDRRGLTRADALELAARKAGRRLLGGSELGAVREALLASFSGDPADVDAAILVRAEAEDLEPREAADVEVLERGLLDGMADTGVTVVGAERSDDEPSQIEFFADQGLTSVDNLDSIAGKVALVLALAGAEGSFGTKESADSLLPDLVAPGGAAQTP